MSDSINMMSLNNPDRQQTSGSSRDSKRDTGSRSQSKVVPNPLNLFKFWRSSDSADKVAKSNETRLTSSAIGPTQEKSEFVLITREKYNKAVAEAEVEADSAWKWPRLSGKWKWPRLSEKKTWAQILTAKPGVTPQFWDELRKYSTEGCQLLKCDKKRYQGYIDNLQEKWDLFVDNGKNFSMGDLARAAVLTEAKLLRWFEAQLNDPSKLADGGKLSEQTVNSLYEQFPKKDKNNSSSAVVYSHVPDCSQFVLLDDHIHQKILTIETVCERACKDPRKQAQAEKIQKECNDYKEFAKKCERMLIAFGMGPDRKDTIEWIYRGQRLLALEKLIEAGENILIETDQNILADHSWSDRVDQEVTKTYGPR